MQVPTTAVGTMQVPTTAVGTMQVPTTANVYLLMYLPTASC